jgi:hypothetical protein
MNFWLLFIDFQSFYQTVALGVGFAYLLLLVFLWFPHLVKLSCNFDVVGKIFSFLHWPAVFFYGFLGVFYETFGRLARSSLLLFEVLGGSGCRLRLLLVVSRSFCRLSLLIEYLICCLESDALFIFLTFFRVTTFWNIASSQSRQLFRSRWLFNQVKRRIFMLGRVWHRVHQLLRIHRLRQTLELLLVPINILKFLVAPPKSHLLRSLVQAPCIIFWCFRLAVSLQLPRLRDALACFIWF